MPDSAASYFLKYAYPCAYVLCDQGRLSEKDHERLQQAAIEKQDVPFEDLERFFPAAFRRLREVAKKRGLHPYSYEAIRAYFREEHNRYIDAGDGTYAAAPYEFREFCKVKELPVLEKKTIDGKLFLKVGKNPDRWVQAPFFKDVETGVVVAVHHALAVDLVE
ncbi:hypothetical protein JXA12_04950 [Candidatus Woesearchaeota archaeon]|nr:hypothetical protein [Candidatus Woesearchaeota archaeon]